MMNSQLTPHVARTIVEDRVRDGAQRRAARAAARSQRVVAVPDDRSRQGAGRSPADVRELERLVAAAADGDGDALRLLVERFTARVRAVARGYRLSAHDAEDVAQTTWLRLFEHIHAIREPGAVGAWIETTARRESLRLLRSAKRERPMEQESLAVGSTEPVAEQRLAAAERRAALVSGVTQLPDHQRRLISWMLAEPDASYAEIAATLELPIGSIGPTRARSFERLRRDPRLVSVCAEPDGVPA